ncbi:MAG TPA: metallophosphoesterase [Chthoniobacterales bacterium]|nr:metallophosphoesterase [Chthoniobacterales bacterium]
MTSNAAQMKVANDVILDGRLALFHQQHQWLAVADLHFGFELSQRAAGSLFPLWGMQTIQARLEELLSDYNPAFLVMVGDLVHDRTAVNPLAALVRDLTRRTEVVLIAGNHDRKLAPDVNVQPLWRIDGFCFHHGHCEVETADEIQVIGHHHPAQTVRDGAGLRLKLPAFVQQDRCWIMPAFSPWAAGTPWPNEAGARIWLCSPNRIMRLHM